MQRSVAQLQKFTFHNMSYILNHSKISRAACHRFAPAADCGDTQSHMCAPDVVKHDFSSLWGTHGLLIAGWLLTRMPVEQLEHTSACANSLSLHKQDEVDIYKIYIDINTSSLATKPEPAKKKAQCKISWCEV